jgi:hypothetical protein
MSPRQRLRLGTQPLELLSRLVLAIVCLALVWYGLMAILLAFKVAPETVNELSRYRSIYDYLAGLRAADVTTTTRLTLGLAGLAGFVLLGLILRQTLPRPYLARHALKLENGGSGTLVVQPRAIERATEAAALQHPGVSAASARYTTDEIALDLRVRRARELPALLRDVQRRAVETLTRHDLPLVPMVVTVTEFDPNPRRELA